MSYQPVQQIPEGVDVENNRPNTRQSHGTSGLRSRVSHTLWPSLRIRDSSLSRRYKEDSQKMVDDIEKETAVCKELIEFSREQRRMRVQNEQHFSSTSAKISGETLRSDAPEKLDRHELLSLYCADVRDASRLKEHLKALEKERIDLKYIGLSQAVADASGYHGLADWAEKTLMHHKDLLEALYQVSFVGAGLTYSTIFSATRGNIGLMCYAFALFNCGFIIPLVTLALLKWASHTPRETLFASPQVWTTLLNLFVYLSVAAVVGAICLLNVTIIVLHFPRDDQGNLQDSPAQFNVAPRPSGTFALMCAVVTIGMTVFALGLHYTANGWDTLFKAVIGHRIEEPGHRLKEYTRALR